MKVIDYHLEPGETNRVLFDYTDAQTRVLKIGGGDLTLILAGEEHWAIAGPDGVDILYLLTEAS